LTLVCPKRDGECPACQRNTRDTRGIDLNRTTVVIGEEAQMQMDETEDYPDILIGCTGGGSNFSGLTFPSPGSYASKVSVTIE
jgi:tryptophan synthase beta chain